MRAADPAHAGAGPGQALHDRADQAPPVDAGRGRAPQAPAAQPHHRLQRQDRRVQRADPAHHAESRHRPAEDDRGEYPVV